MENEIIKISLDKYIPGESCIYQGYYHSIASKPFWEVCL